MLRAGEGNVVRQQTVRHGKVRENALGTQARQRAHRGHLLQSGRKVVAHGKPNAAHARVQLEMHGNLYARLHGLRGERLGVGGGIDCLHDMIFREPVRVAGIGVS